MMARRLNIELDFGDCKRTVGQIEWIPNQRVAAVEWDIGFSATPLPISPYTISSLDGLHLGKPYPFEGLPGVFADSLPDGWGRLLIDRELARQGRALHELTPVDRLAIVGRQGIGALAYWPEEEPAEQDDIDLDWFTETAAQIEGELPVQDLRRLRAGSGGSAGARPKFFTLLNTETGILRDYRRKAQEGFEHYLVKFRSTSDPVSAAREEQSYAEMARLAGIDMPETILLETKFGEDLFAARRFDRQDVTRLHKHTVAGILNADFAVPAIDYEALLRVTRFMTDNRSDVVEMFRRMVFNVLAHNRDDHMKNHAFLMDRNGSWRLSPAYDLSFSNGPGGEHHLSVNGNGRNPSRADLVAVGQRNEIEPRCANEIIEHVAQAVCQWKAIAEASGVPTSRNAEIAERIGMVSGLQI